MQELRLVAVSEDGTYLVLATAGRGTRFTLPVDDRLRAAVRGHFSRLGQFEIEVESPLRPKEIQARIRSGETAEEIAESAGIPVERIRWFEGPVLQEREYMAQQAQRVTVRRPGESTPGPPLGETVEERLGRGGVDLEEVEWDSWKCEDGTWRVRLSFFDNGRPHAAEWVFDPRRRHVSPLDEVAARLTSVEWEDDAMGDTVTPLVPRRPAMKVVSDARDLAPPPPPRGIGTPRPQEFEPSGRTHERTHEPLRAAGDLNREPPVASRPSARRVGDGAPEPEERPADEPREAAPAAVAPVPVPRPAPDEPAAEREPDHEPAEPPAAEEDGRAEREPEPRREEEPAQAPEPVAEEDEQPGEREREPDQEREREPAAEAQEAPERRPEPEEEAAADKPAAARPATEPQPEPSPEPATEPEPEPQVAAEKAPEPERHAEPEPEAEPAAAEAEREEPEPAPSRPAARDKSEPAAKPQRSPHRETSRPPAKKKSGGRPTMPAAPVDPPAAAAAAAAPAAPAASDAPAPSSPGQRPARNRRKAKGKRASVPSWDEIMFGARRPD